MSTNTSVVMQRGLLAIVVALCFFTVACPDQNASSSKYPDPRVRFADYKQTCDGIPGNLPDHFGYYLSPDQKAGACTWYLWVGGDPLRMTGSPMNARGNPRFWRMAEKKLENLIHGFELPINVSILKYVTSTPRGERFAKLGAINDPGCKAATKPDAYGLMLDECSDPYSSGIMGIRLFPNQEFDASKWDANKFLNVDSTIEPPYLSGLTCGVCHISFNPAKPPRDPENPQWENLAPAIGNQYLREGEMFKGGMSDSAFLYWVFQTQQAGTSDTSRISTDFINNPNAINSIWYILSARPKHAEVMNDGTTKEVPHILKDGSDSIGPAGAALRVYVNIGTCPDYRYSLEYTFLGIPNTAEPLLPPVSKTTAQRPFEIAKAEKECVDWQLTAARMDKAANFLDANQPYYLKDAPGGTSYITNDAAVLDMGKTVFAQECARCHSSKLPDEVVKGGLDKHSPQAKTAWVNLVKSPDFLDKNFLSDDERYPLVSKDPRFALGTNADRALGTNPQANHIWNDFSSKTFKQLPPPGNMIVQNPFAPGQTFTIPIRYGGYYRTPSLINCWATAPYLHNNMLGLFNNDPSVQGRMAAYQDATEKLLWPEKRLGKATIKVTGKDSILKIRDIEIHFPAGTPIDLFANINLYAQLQPVEVLRTLHQVAEHPDVLVRLVHALKNEGPYDQDLKAFMPLLLAQNQSPDFIQDHGHTFGSQLPDDQKRALIEYMKTF
jgi:cytochrome c5